LVFEDVPADELESTRQYFLKLSKKITDQLHICGFEYCPGDMMASNPKWCLSLSEWKNQFDYRPLYGDYSLTEILTNHIFSLFNKESIFMSLMAKNSLGNPPPLTFFRNFVVEKDGEHQDNFDIKSRAMMPLTDAARILTLNHQISNVNNTFERFEKLAEVETLPRFARFKKQQQRQVFKPSGVNQNGTTKFTQQFPPGRKIAGYFESAVSVGLFWLSLINANK